MKKIKNFITDPAKFTPRFLVYILAEYVRKCMRIDYKYDAILYNELNQWIERNKKKWRAGIVQCTECQYHWTAVHLLKSTHIECPKCKKLVGYYEIERVEIIDVLKHSI